MERGWLTRARRTLHAAGASFVRITSNGHELWRLNGVPVLLPCSPSDCNSERIFRGALRRAQRARGNHVEA